MVEELSQLSRMDVRICRKEWMIHRESDKVGQTAAQPPPLLPRSGHDHTLLQAPRAQPGGHAKGISL